MAWAPRRVRRAPAAWAHISLLWAPGNLLKIQITESTLICINYANQVVVAHRRRLDESHAL